MQTVLGEAEEGAEAAPGFGPIVRARGARARHVRQADGRTRSGRCTRCGRTLDQGCSSWCSEGPPGPEPAQPASSLVQGKQLGRAHTKSFPTCGEAVIVYGCGGLSEPPERKPRGEGDPVASAARSARGRRNRIRRYCVHNRLTRLWTLTYANAEWDYAVVKQHINRFIRRLRKLLGKKFPYLWVIERHPKGHGLHVHLAMRGHFIGKKTLESLWGQGWVNFSDRRKGASQAFKGAELAAYFAKELAGYISKEEAEVNGQHFYDVAQNFQPPAVVEDVRGSEDVIVAHIATKHFKGKAPVSVWRSSDVDDWEGPPVVVLRWYGRDRC